MTDADWRVYVRDEDLVAQGRIGGFVDFGAELRICDAQSWAITLPFEDDHVAQLLEARAGIRVMYRDDIVVAGPMLDFERVWKRDSDNILIHGFSDEIFLAGRVAHQAPGASAPSSNLYAGAYDVRTGPAETVIKQYVDVNAGPSAVTARRVPHLAVAASTGAGATVTGEARQQNLLEFIRGLADGGGVCFHVRESTGVLTFDVFEPIDRTADVRFSRAHQTISAFRYARAAPLATVEYVAGAGEEAAREFVVREDAAATAAWWRIERFVDARDVDPGDITRLNERGDEALGEHGESFEAEATVQGVTTTFLDDWRLGDLVTIVLDGATIVEQVRGAKLSIDGAGVIVTPVIQRSPRGLLDEHADFVRAQLRRLQTRSLNLERR